MTLKNEIIRAAARAAYVSAWADYMENAGKAKGWAGQDLMDLAPKTPAAANKWAKKLIATMERMNGKTIEAMAADACSRPHSHSWEKEGTYEDFGHYTAMQALGHGVGWSDSHPAHGFKIPHGEFYCHNARSCEGYVSGREGIGSVG